MTPENAPLSIADTYIKLNTKNSFTTNCKYLQQNF